MLLFNSCKARKDQSPPDKNLNASVPQTKALRMLTFIGRFLLQSSLKKAIRTLPSLLFRTYYRKPRHPIRQAVFAIHSLAFLLQSAIRQPPALRLKKSSRRTLRMLKP